LTELPGEAGQELVLWGDQVIQDVISGNVGPGVTFEDGAFGNSIRGARIVGNGGSGVLIYEGEPVDDVTPPGAHDNFISKPTAIDPTKAFKITRLPSSGTTADEEEIIVPNIISLNAGAGIEITGEVTVHTLGRPKNTTVFAFVRIESARFEAAAV
jgi:hypothetical protein